MKTTATRTPARAGAGNGKARKPRGDVDARTLARIHAAATVVRMRQEGLYDRLADRFRVAFEEGVDRSREAMDVAAERAREQLTAAGALTVQQGERLKAFLLRDLDRTAQEWRTARRSAAEHLSPGRVGAGALASLAAVLEAAGDRLHGMARSADEALAYRTGEVTSAGILTCANCSETLQFRRTGTVPPCPRCAGTAFTKGY